MSSVGGKRPRERIFLSFESAGFMRIREKVVYNEASFGLFACSLMLASKPEFLPALSRPRIPCPHVRPRVRSIRRARTPVRPHAMHIMFKAHTLIQVGIGQSHDSKSILHEPQIFS